MNWFYKIKKKMINNIIIFKEKKSSNIITSIICDLLNLLVNSFRTRWIKLSSE